MNKPIMYDPVTLKRSDKPGHHKLFKSPPFDEDDIVILGGYPGGLSHREEEILERIKKNEMRHSKRKQVKR